MVPDAADLERLTAGLGYCFGDLDHLRLALTHRSAVRGSEGSNERLELLGDSVLDLCVCDLLLERLPAADSGELTEFKSFLVSNENLAKVANGLHLSDCLCVGGGQRLVGDRTEQRVLASAFEAVLGAVYLDGGIAAAKRIVFDCLFSKPLSETLDLPLSDGNHKAALQEWLQARQRSLPLYSVVGTEGAANRPTFFVEARSGELVGTGAGPRKRVAENEAAAHLLRLLVASDLSEPGSGAGTVGSEA